MRGVARPDWPTPFYALNAGSKQVSSPLYIEKLFAFVVANPEGEGVIGMRTPNGNWIPLVGADKERIESLRDVAEGTAKASGRPVRLVEFSVRKDLEVIK